MVQAIENWSEVRGRIEGVTRTDPDSVDLRIHVAEVEPVPGFPNLLSGVLGQSITVRLAVEDGAGSTPAAGDTLRFRVRKAGPDRYFAQPGSLSSAPGPDDPGR